MDASRRLRRNRRSDVSRQVIIGVLWLSVATVLSAADGQNAPSATPETITVDVPLSQFVYRRRLSADRVGVLESAPAEGDRVEAGTVVARLRDDVPRAMLTAADERARSTAEIEAAEKYAESEGHEHLVMVEANAGRPAKPTYPRTDVERARLRAESAALQAAVKWHEQRISQLLRDQAVAELGTFQIETPISGVVTRVFRHAGEGVQQAEAILEVVNTDRIRVEGRVPSEVASRVWPGAAAIVRFHAGTPEEVEVTGAVGFVDVSAEGVGPERRVRLWAEIENPEHRLRDGLPAKMVITLTPRTRPATAKAGAPTTK